MHGDPSRGTGTRTSRVLAAAVAALAIAGCTGGGEPSPAREHGTATDPLPRGGRAVDLDPARFTTSIDHRYWPMEPGTRWTYREDDGEGEVLDVRVTVTNVTRRLADGVSARVVRDTVTSAGELVEDTLDFYAQDSAGTLWYLGERTVELEGGRVASREGSFEAGVDGAQPGVVLPAHPRPGQHYRQEFRAGEAEDRGAVLSTDEMAEVEAGFYRHALLTRDTNPLEPRVLEYKLYAPGVGPVLTLDASGGQGREELVSMTTVTPRVSHAAGVTALGQPYE